ncbi:MAG: hypothetical protein AAFU73_22105 [Planctomycetota bacterium]
MGALEVLASSTSAALSGIESIEFELEPGLGMERPDARRLRERVPLDELTRFDSLLPGVYRWTARGSKGDYRDSGESVVGLGEPSLLVLPLPDVPATIRGTVTVSGENATAGRVQCVGLGEAASYAAVTQIEAQGLFSFSVPRPGTYRLFCLVPDPGRPTLEGGTAPEIAFARTIALPERERTISVDLAIDVDRLDVETIDINGVPIDGAIVILNRAQMSDGLWVPEGSIMRDRVARATTRSSGTTSFVGLERGPYWVEAYTQDRRLIAHPKLVDVDADDPRVSLTLRPPAIVEFQLRSNDSVLELPVPRLERRFVNGSGVVGARDGLSVWIRPESMARPDAPWNRITGFTRLESDERGCVRVRVPAGTRGPALLQLASGGRILAGTARWDATEVRSSPIPIDLDPTASVRCRCVDDDGMPQMFFVSASMGELGQLPPLEATNTRAFEHVLTGLPAGTVEFVLRTSERMSGEVSIRLSPAEEKSLLVTLRR